MPIWIILLLATQGAGAEAPPETTSPTELWEAVPAAEFEPGWHTLLRMEASMLALLPQGGAAKQEGYAQVTPTLVLDGGAALGVNLGAPVRVRLWGGEAVAGRVRKEDWDSLSDWGQLVRVLKLGSEDSPWALRVGVLEDYSLLSGQLVRRYSNRAHPDYHPAGAYLMGTLGPVYLEAFTSDVLGARLMGAQAELDLEHVLTGLAPEPGRYTLGVSVVRDWGRAGGESPRVTLAHVDATAVVLVRPDYEVHVLGGWGGRPGVGGAWGAVLGVGADGVTRTLDMKLRLEARRQHGGFRQGFFGPDYEVERTSAGSRSGVPVAEAPFPEGFSAYGEVVVGWDGVRLGEVLQRHLHLSLGAEVFDWGRVDVDGRLAVQWVDRTLEVAASGLLRGLGRPGARHLYAGEVRWRFARSLYLLAQGGTRLYPGAEGTLLPVPFASLGVGMDHAR